MGRRRRKNHIILPPGHPHVKITRAKPQPKPGMCRGRQSTRFVAIGAVVMGVLIATSGGDVMMAIFALVAFWWWKTQL